MPRFIALHDARGRTPNFKPINPAYSHLLSVKSAANDTRATHSAVQPAVNSGYTGRRSALLRSLATFVSDLYLGTRPQSQPLREPANSTSPHLLGRLYRRPAHTLLLLRLGARHRGSRTRHPQRPLSCPARLAHHRLLGLEQERPSRSARSVSRWAAIIPVVEPDPAVVFCDA